jgi:LEA14-like dessication related protein
MYVLIIKKENENQTPIVSGLQINVYLE